MSLLALDLGTTTGWASSTGSSGLWDLRPSKHASHGRRYFHFKEKLITAIGLYKTTLIVYEEVRAHTAVDAAHCYGGFLATLQTICEERGLAYQGVPVGTIKKHATGKGNADKDMMFNAACLKFKGINVIDHNHADALWILDYAKENLLY